MPSILLFLKKKIAQIIQIFAKQLIFSSCGAHLLLLHRFNLNGFTATKSLHRFKIMSFIVTQSLHRFKIKGLKQHNRFIASQGWF